MGCLGENTSILWTITTSSHCDISSPYIHFVGHDHRVVLGEMLGWYARFKDPPRSSSRHVSTGLVHPLEGSPSLTGRLVIHSDRREIRIYRDRRGGRAQRATSRSRHIRRSKGDPRNPDERPVPRPTYIIWWVPSKPHQTFKVPNIIGG